MSENEFEFAAAKSFCRSLLCGFLLRSSDGWVGVGGVGGVSNRPYPLIRVSNCGDTHHR
jgi:hypothetical protein